jgi:formate dehydrogenase major subunit
MHVGSFVRGLGRFVETPFIPTPERTSRRFPLILTTGRILSQYNVGAQTRRTDNVVWHPEDVLEIHPFDAAERGVADGGLVELSSRVGTTSLRAVLTERVPVGVVYTTFHYPVTGANVDTTEYSDWATNCPEYKVTAVQVRALVTARNGKSRSVPSDQRVAAGLGGGGGSGGSSSGARDPARVLEGTGVSAGTHVSPVSSVAPEALP